MSAEREQIARVETATAVAGKNLDGFEYTWVRTDDARFLLTRLRELGSEREDLQVWARLALDSKKLMGPREYQERPDLLRVWVKTRYAAGRDVQALLARAAITPPTDTFP